MAERTFRVPPELAGARLDVALVELFEGSLSRTRLKELIEDGGVRVDGTPTARASQPLEAGQEIELRDVPRSRERAGGPVGGELVLVYEDEHLAVIDKPAGQLSHPTTIVRGGTVSELAAARFGALPSPQGEDRPGIVHRLDADTSGLLVIVKSAAAAEPLVAAFRARTVEKRYLALVHGEPRFDSDWINAPLGRSGRHADRVCVMPAGEGRPAETFYRVCERFGRFALLECRPTTGRTHQIRVHLASIELPLVGDRLYTGRSRVPLPAGAPAIERHLLHAAGLCFTHPVTGEGLVFESVPPADFQEWLAYLRAARG
ncbi:MAG: RluA family pseudouridine synthase [Planctomycetes bacterium]|nr:RluA family pseudouridine synthase [Planctomycetota bacterium]